jgi:hypothetical protein
MRRSVPMLAVLVIAVLTLGVGRPLLGAAGAAPMARGAVRLLDGEGAPLRVGSWQSWADASLVPTVRGNVTVRLTGCPGVINVAGCVFSAQPRTIYLKQGLEHPRGVLLHELGHVYDLTVMNDQDRSRFRRIMRRPRASWWRGTRPLAEWFAEAYAWCARYRTVVSLKKYAIYRYDPSPSQHRRACAIIRTAGRDRTPPATTEAPPAVTRDPAPPAPPPVAAKVVPGNLQRDPGPGPAESATLVKGAPAPIATPAAIPTATPTSQPVATPTAVPTPVSTVKPVRTPTPTPVPTPEPEPDDATSMPSPDEPTESPDADPAPVATPIGEPEPAPTPAPQPASDAPDEAATPSPARSRRS